MYSLANCSASGKSVGSEPLGRALECVEGLLPFECALWGRDVPSDVEGADGVEAELEPVVCAEREARLELDGSPMRDAFLALRASACSAVEVEFGFGDLFDEDAFFFECDVASGGGDRVT